MPRQDVLLSQKFNNYNYAPGIATYGADGKTGIAGYDGNNIYFTDCDLVNDVDNRNLNELAELLRGNYLPVKGSTTAISRSYKNDDLFFDQNGIIYKLKNIDELIGTVNKDTYGKYFSIAGKISVSDSSYFDNVDGRIILNSSNFGGFDVITSSDLSTNIDSNAVVNIISNNIDENDNIELIKMQSIDDVDIEDGNLDIYYKTTDNAYYLDSNMPIVINSNVKINDSVDNIDYDNYSSILTSNDPITYFKHICDKLRYNVLYDSDENRYKLVIYQEDGRSDDLEYLVNRNETVYGKVYTDSNEQILVRLSDIISSSIDSSKYYEHGDFKYLDVTAEAPIIKNSIRTHGVVENNTVVIDISTSDMNVKLNNDQHAVDISINTTYPNTIGKFNNIIIESANNISQQFVINNEEYKEYNGIIYGNSTIAINICPNEYELDSSITRFPFVTYPINIQLEPDNTLNTTINYIYFEAKTTSQVNPYTSLLSIRNIGISNYLYNYNSANRPCIQIYLPDSVDSIQKFALLHNTEIFINYQE